VGGARPGRGAHLSGAAGDELAGFELSAGQVGALALGVVLIFWAVGAYNRLVALRNTVADAWAQVHEGLKRRAEAAAPLAALLAAPLASEQRALDTWLADHATAERAAANMAARPLDAARAAAWLAAEATLAASTSRVFALMDGAGALPERERVAELVAGWRGGEQQAQFARRLFNDAAEAHDAAVRQFPTTVLARLYAFAPAGRL
jgi:LemA protein